MSSRIAIVLSLLLIPAAALADEPPKVAKTEKVANAERAAKAEKGGDKVLSGMSVVGNDEAPKSLVIVPWKSSELGGALDVSRALDDGRQPVDRDVFRRELDYYEIRVGHGKNP